MANETRAKQTLIPKPNKTRIPSKNRLYIGIDTSRDAGVLLLFFLLNKLVSPIQNMVYAYRLICCGALSTLNFEQKD